MNKEWAEFEVYEIFNGEKHTLAYCNEYTVADILTRLLAENDPKESSYYLTSVEKPDSLVVGGGWYEEYFMKDGILQHRGLE